MEDFRVPDLRGPAGPAPFGGLRAVHVDRDVPPAAFPRAAADRPVFGATLCAATGPATIAKPMAQATGREILEELAHQLRLTANNGAEFFDGARGSCRIPFIMVSVHVACDRPPVIPRGAQNFAIIGQFCEIPRDCVFTVGISRAPPGRPVHGLTGRWCRHHPSCAAT